VYDEGKKSDFSDLFYRILNTKVVDLDFFPGSYVNKAKVAPVEDKDFNRRISEVSFLRIEDFITKESSVDQDRIDQIHFLRLLMWNQRTSRRREFISTPEILEHLNSNRSETLSTEQFRSNIVGKLRDKGILIASSREGYKVPVSVADLKLYLDHGM